MVLGVVVVVLMVCVVFGIVIIIRSNRVYFGELMVLVFLIWW